jgi:hypothetical protein
LWVGGVLQAFSEKSTSEKFFASEFDETWYIDGPFDGDNFIKKKILSDDKQTFYTIFFKLRDCSKNKVARIK